MVRKPAETSKPAVTSNVKRVPAVVSKGIAGIGKRTKSMNVLQRLTLISVSNLLERLRYRNAWFMTYCVVVNYRVYNTVLREK